MMLRAQSGKTDMKIFELQNQIIATTSINEFFPGNWLTPNSLTINELTIGFK